MSLEEVSYARNGDVSIAYGVLGEGPPDLVFVGGFVSHLEIIWEAEPVRRFFDRLASFARVIVWDKREQGLSDGTSASRGCRTGSGSSPPSSRAWTTWRR